MDTRKYEIFLQAVDLRSMTAAAAEAGYTQSGISHIIKGLESEFGFPLLRRHRTGVSPTPDAERLIPVLRDLVNRNEQLEQTAALIRGVETGVVRVGTITSISAHWLPRVLKEFHQDHPNISVKLAEGGGTEVEEWLEAGRVDFGLYGYTGPQAYDWFPLSEDYFLAVLPKNHPMAGLESFPIRAFNGASMIAPPESVHREIHRLFDKYRVKPDYRYSAIDDYTTMALVEQGLGVSVKSALIMKGYAHCDVCVMELEPRCFRTLGIVIPNIDNASPAAKTLISYIRRIVACAEGGQAIQ